MKPRATVLLRDTVNWGQGIPGLTGYEICIVLTRGYLALVSPEDADDLSSVNWKASTSSSQQVRAVRSIPRDAHDKRQTIFMHRQLMKPTDDQQVDHRDQHRLFCYKIVDNRRYNLRNVSASQNGSNQRKQVGRSSMFKGVTWHKRCEKWMTRCMVNQRTIHLGYFASELEAALAYNAAHQKHFPGISEGLNHITTT